MKGRSLKKSCLLITVRRVWSLLRLEADMRRGISSMSLTSLSRRSLSTFHVNIPDLSPPNRRPKVQIPLLPDFWGAANRVNEQPRAASTGPVMLTVASVDTHLSQPSHKVYQPTESDHEPTASAAEKLWHSTLRISNSPSRQNVRPLKRNLTSEERRGVYMLFGLLGSSFLFSGLIERMEKTKGQS